MFLTDHRHDFPDPDELHASADQEVGHGGRRHRRHGRRHVRDGAVQPILKGATRKNAEIELVENSPRVVWVAVVCGE